MSTELSIIVLLGVQLVGLIVYAIFRDEGSVPDTSLFWSNSYARNHARAEARLADQLAAHVERVQARWRTEGRTVVFGPVAGRYHGEMTGQMNTLDPDRGALGVVDDHLRFVGMSSAGFEISIPLNTIRWISQLGVEAVKANALTIYRELNDEWRLTVIATDRLTELVQALQPFAPLATEPDYGPARALLAHQDIYGRWDRHHAVTLYLAPDRLLADWHTAVTLADLRALAVLPTADYTRGLLRITTANPDGGLPTVGFEMSTEQAEEWAAVVSRRTGIAVENESGRKKK